MHLTHCQRLAAWSPAVSAMHHEDPNRLNVSMGDGREVQANPSAARTGFQGTRLAATPRGMAILSTELRELPGLANLTTGTL